MNLLKYARDYDLFLIRTSIVISRTIDFVFSATERSTASQEKLDEIINSWHDINSSLWFALPSKMRLRLKVLARTISTDLAKFGSSHHDQNVDGLLLSLHNARMEAEFLLNPKRNLTDILAHSIHDTRRSLVPAKMNANNSTNHLLPFADLVYIWNLCHTLSKSSRHQSAEKCKMIFDLANQYRCDDSAVQQEISKEIMQLLTDIENSMRHENRSCNLMLLRISVPILTLITVAALLMVIKDFSGATYLDDQMSSDGENILFESADIGCPSKQEKVEAVNYYKRSKSFSGHNRQHALDDARTLMQKVVNNCPIDSEAIIYLNNYRAMHRINSKASSQLMDNKTSTAQSVKIAVVVPKSRSNGIKDSLEILRGVARAQYFINKQADSGKTPYFIVKIFDDGTIKKEAEERRIHSCKIAHHITRSNNNYDIAAVIGHFSSDSTEATSRIYSLYNIPVISPTSTNERIIVAGSITGHNGDRLINRILPYLSGQASKNFLANYGMILESANQKYTPNLCRTSSTDKLMLNSNIYRMPPNDKAAQENIFHYLSSYNTIQVESKYKVNRIVLIWEDSRTSRYSQGFQSSLKNGIGEDYDFRYEFCRLKNSAQFVKEEKCIKSDILNNPDGSTALILAPNSQSIPKVKNYVKNLLMTIQDRKRLLIIGADSFMTADLSDPLYRGVLLSSASPGRILREPPGSKRDDSIQVMFNWRSQMAYDSMLVLSGTLRNADQDQVDFKNTGVLRTFILDKLDSNMIGGNSIIDNKPIRFDEETHDRITSGSENLNVLLCLQYPGQTNPFKQIKVYSSSEQQEEAGDEAICLP